jgi:predicted RNA-binding protein YlxR (DUF448 family)
LPVGQARPQRTCLGCRQEQDRSRLVRYVRAPDGTVLVDYRQKLPGRGAYTCLNSECISQAVSRRQFDRAFRSACLPVAAADLRQRLIEELHERLAALLGMARKSSQIISGGSQVLAALDRPERLQAVILADDVSAGVAEKVVSKAEGRALPCLRFSTKADLGQLLGRGERSVTALIRGRLAETFLSEWQKFTELSGES